jgi:hypothetical protein
MSGILHPSRSPRGNGNEMPITPYSASDVTMPGIPCSLVFAGTHVRRVVLITASAAETYELEAVAGIALRVHVPEISRSKCTRAVTLY